ncbi:MAG: Respiratory supercomplex factor 1, mitochondrial [Icmadophila ericetorum]|nr:Respiratory supercomplex factor 1, mitochondrial [Icmadophila ericetorum]
MADTPLPSSFDDNSDFYEENRWQKFSRRLKEEPLIPFGCVLTCYALLGATRSIRAGDHHTTNRMFRFRIYAQGFTLLCMLAGSVYYASDREKRKVFQGGLAEKKAKERNEAWIRELEARDREEKEDREREEERRKRMAEKRRDEKEGKVGERITGIDKGFVAKCVVEREERGFGILDGVRRLKGSWR